MNSAMPFNNLSRQNGVALLMAMLVVAIATITAVSLVHNQSVSIRRTGLLQTHETAMLYSLGLEDYARLFLQKDQKDSKTDHLKEDWAVGIPLLPIEGGFLTGVLVDAQSKINLNAVLKQEMEDRLRVLCNNLDVSTEFIESLKDWIDSDLETIHADGAEDDYYTALQQPYRSANRLMSDVSELLLIKGMDREKYEILKPYITVLPTETTLNINTISPEVYKTIGGNVDAERFVEERDNEPFESLADFEKRMDQVLPENVFSVSTDYFEADGQVSLGTKNVFVHTVIHRDGKGGTRVLYRRLGEFS